ncbi:unnamed protein product [Darwinula stevensoni]|uniref:UPAR/Ly6 domain-containing protein n=1 Tax=Darwinula stevensoni TaxID=69355 RepID=A0A7R8X8I6_9CRUS|nr:unnamed protein product [Darwinula stevensoni]CAG0887954.1 unnamed protein product [Darwinula stevensoni]
MHCWSSIFSSLVVLLVLQGERVNGLTCYTCVETAMTGMCNQEHLMPTPCQGINLGGEKWYCVTGYNIEGRIVYASCIPAHEGGCRNIELLEIFGVTKACLCDEDLCNKPSTAIRPTPPIPTTTQRTPHLTKPLKGQGPSYLMPPHLLHLSALSFLMVMFHGMQ